MGTKSAFSSLKQSKTVLALLATLKGLYKAKRVVCWFPAVNKKNLICDAVYQEILLKYHRIFPIFKRSEEPTHVFVALTSCSVLYLGSLVVDVKFPVHGGPYMNAAFDD